MPRFSILGMMGGVLATAVAVAALRDANDIWAGLLLLMTVGLIGAALLGIGSRTGKARAGWAGFALFAGGYLAIALGPWPDTATGPGFATTQLLDFVHERVVPLPTPATMSLVGLNQQRNALASQDLEYRRRSTNPNDPAHARIKSQIAHLDDQIKTFPFVEISMPPPSHRWKSLLPGAARREAFLQVGHCLFALLAGLIGAAVARRFRAGAAADRRASPTRPEGAIPPDPVSQTDLNVPPA